MDSLVKHSFMPRVSSLIFDGGILFYFYFFCFVECFRGTKNLFSQAGSSSWFLLLHKELLKNPLCKSVDPRRLRNRMYANSSTAWQWNHIKHHFFSFGCILSVVIVSCLTNLFFSIFPLCIFSACLFLTCLSWFKFALFPFFCLWMVCRKGVDLWILSLCVSDV